MKSLCPECGRTYTPNIKKEGEKHPLFQREYSPMDWCQPCRLALIEFFERQMRFHNKPKLLKAAK